MSTLRIITVRHGYSGSAPYSPEYVRSVLEGLEHVVCVVDGRCGGFSCSLVVTVGDHAATSHEIRRRLPYAEVHDGDV